MVLRQRHTVGGTRPHGAVEGETHGWKRASGARSQMRAGIHMKMYSNMRFLGYWVGGASRTACRTLIRESYASVRGSRFLLRLELRQAFAFTTMGLRRFIRFGQLAAAVLM